MGTYMMSSLNHTATPAEADAMLHDITSNPLFAANEKSSLQLARSFSSGNISKLSQVSFSRHTLVLWWPPRKQTLAWDVTRYRGKLERLHLVMTNPDSCRLGWWVLVFIASLIVVSSVVFVAETDPQFLVYKSECKMCEPLAGADRGNETLVSTRAALRTSCLDCEPSSPEIFFWFELACVAIFSTEYLIKIVTSIATPTAAEIASMKNGDTHTTWHTPLNRLRLFLIEPMNLVDLAAILPFFVQTILGTHSAKATSVFRVFRLIRLVRMLRLNSVADTVAMFWEVFRSGFMAHVAICVLLSIAMLVLGSLLFVLEHGNWNLATGDFDRVGATPNDPHSPSTFSSIPMAIWYVIVTFTTTGYGDLFPNTKWGRVMGVMTMFAGALLLSFSVTVIADHSATAFVEREQKAKRVEESKRRRVRILFTALECFDQFAKRNAFNKLRAETRSRKAKAAKSVDMVRKAVIEVLQSQSLQFTTELSDRIERIVAQKTAKGSAKSQDETPTGPKS